MNEPELRSVYTVPCTCVLSVHSAGFTWQVAAIMVCVFSVMYFHLQNDVLYVEWDIKLYSLTHSLLYSVDCTQDKRCA